MIGESSWQTWFLEGLSRGALGVHGERHKGWISSALEVLITWEWPLVGLGGMSPLPVRL